MSFYSKALLILISILFLSSCDLNKRSHETYRVGLRLIPKALSPWDNQVNTNLLIMLQLYIPLFEVVGSEQIRSRLLDKKRTRVLDETHSKFMMCLNKDLKFFDGSPVTIDDFKNSLLKAHGKIQALPQIEKIENEKNCLKVSLKEVDTDYFRKLTSVATSIFKSNTLEKDIPIGVGPYSIKLSTNDQMILDRNNIFPSQLRRLEFVKYDSSLDEEELSRIHDLNHVYQLPIPPDRKLTYRRIERPSLKSYILFYGNASLKDRLLFAACLSKHPISEVFGLKLQPVKGFLPPPLLGSFIDEGPKYGSCPKMKTKKEFRLVHFNKEVIRSLEFFFQKNQDKLPFKIKVDFLPFERVPELVFSHENVITLIGFDSSGSYNALLDGSSSFFRSFVGNQRLTKNENKTLDEYLSQALDAKKLKSKEFFYKKAHEVLLSRHYFLPLGQDILIQFYPSFIKKVSWADPYSPFPLYSFFEIQ